MKAGEAAQVRIDLDDALDILDHSRDEDILRAGEALGVLDEDLDNEEVLYRHQLLQEYFAARPLAEQPEPERVRVAWEVGKTPTGGSGVGFTGSSPPRAVPLHPVPDPPAALGG